jgi:hypothetical protein
MSETTPEAPDTGNGDENGDDGDEGTESQPAYAMTGGGQL